MALDEALARTSDALPTFRVYYWNSPSLSLGYFQKSAEVLNSLACRGTLQRAPTVVRRPTGGTAVLHDSQPSFSLVLRTPAKVIQIYHLLGLVMIEALKTLGIDAKLWVEAAGVKSSRVQRLKGSMVQEFPFCTSNLSPYDVILQGRVASVPSLRSRAGSGGPIKVAGYSARRFQGVTLFQGYLHFPKPVVPGQLIEAMIMGMEKITEARLMEGNLTEAETVLTWELRQNKSLQQDWNYKR